MYYASRREAEQNRESWERVVRLGRFARGSFGLQGRLTPGGQPWGGPASLMTVWATEEGFRDPKLERKPKGEKPYGYVEDEDAYFRVHNRE
jgi:hypothetical protein